MGSDRSAPHFDAPSRNSELARTPRLSLRRFAEADISSEYIAWLNNRHHLQFSNQRFVVHTEETCRDYLRSFIETPHLFIALLRLEDGAMIGTSTVYVNPIHGTADLGILIGDRHAGLGYGTEAWQGVLEVCSSAGIRKATAGTLASNHAMIRIILASGMKLEGNRVDQELVAGLPIDQLLFGMLL